MKKSPVASDPWGCVYLVLFPGVIIGGIIVNVICGPGGR